MIALTTEVRGSTVDLSRAKQVAYHTSLVAQNGPIHVQPNGSWFHNNFSWNTLADTIWIDQPVGKHTQTMTGELHGRYSALYSYRHRLLDSRLDRLWCARHAALTRFHWVLMPPAKQFLTRIRLERISYVTLCPLSAVQTIEHGTIYGVVWGLRRSASCQISFRCSQALRPDPCS